MAEAGILARGDRVELIDGEVAALTPVGPRHNAAVDRAKRVLGKIVGDRAILCVQGSIRLHRFTEPEPDLDLLRPRDGRYDGRYLETRRVDDGQTLAADALPDCVVAARDLMA